MDLKPDIDRDRKANMFKPGVGAAKDISHSSRTDYQPIFMFKTMSGAIKTTC